MSVNFAANRLRIETFSLTLNDEVTGGSCYTCYCISAVVPKLFKRNISVKLVRNLGCIFLNMKVGVLIFSLILNICINITQDIACRKAIRRISRTVYISGDFQELISISRGGCVPCHEGQHGRLHV